MADNSVKLTFTGNEADAARAIATLEKKYDTLKNSVDQLSKRTRKGTDEAVSGFEGAIRGAQGLASAVTGINGPMDGLLKLVGKVKEEFEDLKQRQSKAASANVTYAGAAAQAVLNARGDKDFGTAATLEAEVARVAGRTGTSPTAVANAFSSAMSAKGGLSGKDASKAVEAVMRLVPNLPEAQPYLAGAALDIRKVTPQASAEAAIGATLQLGQASRVTDLDKLAKNAIPAVLAAQRTGGMDFQAAGAQYSALSQALNDFEGGRTGTALVALHQQLKEAFPTVPGVANATGDDRVRYLQQNSEARNAFLYGGKFGGKALNRPEFILDEGGNQIPIRQDRASFETKSRAGVEALLSGQGDVVKNQRDAAALIPKLADGAKVYQGALRDLTNSPAQQIDRAQRTTQAFTELAKLKNVSGALGGVSREGLEEMLSSVGVGKFERGIALDRFELASRGGSQDALGEAIKGLEAQRQEKLDPGFFSFDPRVGLSSLFIDMDQANKEAQVQAGLLKEAVDALKLIKDAIDETNRNGKPKPARNANAE